jgi:hypothetical protein
MENQVNDQQDEELDEATKGLEPQDSNVEDEKIEDLGEIKPEEPQVPEVDLKPLPKGLKYKFLGPDKTYPVIVSDELIPKENEKLLNLLKKHMKVTGYSINDLKGLSPAFCTHRIPMEVQCKPVVDHQRRLTHAMREVVKKQVIKLLDAGIIYPAPHSEWVNPVHCVPKKGGLTMVKNEKDELIPQRTVTRWRMCIDYRKLNKATKKDHFPPPFIEEMLDRLANHAYFCFPMGTRGSCKFPFTWMINTKQRSHALMERLHIEGCPSVYATLRPLFNVAWWPNSRNSSKKLSRCSRMIFLFMGRRSWIAWQTWTRSSRGVRR